MRIRYHFNNHPNSNRSLGTSRSSTSTSSSSSNTTIHRTSGFIHRRPRRVTSNTAISSDSEEPHPPPDEDVPLSRRTMNEVHFYLRPTPVSSSSDDDDTDTNNAGDNTNAHRPSTRRSTATSSNYEPNVEEAMEAGQIHHPRYNFDSPNNSANNRRRQQPSWSVTISDEQRASMNQNDIISNVSRWSSVQSSEGSNSLTSISGRNISNIHNNNNNNHINSNITSYFTFPPNEGSTNNNTSHGSQNNSSNSTTDGSNVPLLPNANNNTNSSTIAATSSNNAMDTFNAAEDEEWDTILDTEDITQLTTRLRCLFAMLTCPIVPLAATLTLLLLWVLYSALLLDWGKPCDQPLRAYALLSAAMFAYTPHHRTAKRILFGYLRERDGPTRPWGVRVYDQMYHATCLLWMFAGISWTSRSTTCAQTCPHLFRSTKVFVLVQTTFMSMLVIPLLCLPCIYLWLVRQAAVISANRRLLRRRKRVPPEKVIASFITIDLSNESIRQFLQGKECCICMSDFMEEIHHSTSTSSMVPVEGTGSSPNVRNDSTRGNIRQDTSNNNIVVGVIQTQCGHLFHRACIATWLKTPYSGSYKCPLCREDLIPPDLERTDNEEGNNMDLATSLNNEETKEEDSSRDELVGEQQSLLPAASYPNDSLREIVPTTGLGLSSSWHRMAGNTSNNRGRSDNLIRSQSELEDLTHLNII